MKRLNEDFLDDQELDIEQTKISKTDALKEPSYDSGFEYRISLTYMKDFQSIVEQLNGKDFTWIYTALILPAYRYLDRVSDITDYSEIALQSSDEDYSDRYYLYSIPESIEELKKLAQEEYYVKRSNIRLTFYANITFKARRVLYLLNSLGAAFKCVTLQIYKKDSVAPVCDMSSMIPLTYILKDSQEDKDYWLTGEEIGWPHRSKSHNLGDIYDAALTLTGKTLENYIVLKDIINYPSAVEQTFDKIVSNEMHKKVKHFNIKQSVKDIIDNGVLNQDYICNNDVVTLFCHDVTKPFDEYDKYTFEKDKLFFDYVIRQGFSGREIRIQKWELFLHDSKRSYGRFVSALFYVGPCCYTKTSGDKIVVETYIAFDLYDARSSVFVKNLSASLQQPLSDKDMEWLIEKLKKTT